MAGLTPRPKSKSLFWPSGPITAKYAKNREHLHKGGDVLVWSKSGPPTHETRQQKSVEVPALIDATNPARMAGRAVVELRRDLNSLMSKNREGGTVVGRLLQPPGKSYQSKDEKKRETDMDDWSDDELWESLSRPATSGTTRADLKKKAIAKLVSDRCLDSVKHTSRPGSAITTATRLSPRPGSATATAA